MAITKWSISSDGTAEGTEIRYDGRVLSEIMDLEITVRPGEFVIGRISFVTKLESAEVNEPEIEVRAPANIDELIKLNNEMIRLYVRKELMEWLGGSFA